MDSQRVSGLSLRSGYEMPHLTKGLSQLPNVASPPVKLIAKPLTAAKHRQ